MDTVLSAVFGFFGGMLRMLAFYSVFYVIGNAILKLLTLGRYPRINHLRQQVRQAFPEFELIAVFGLLCTVGAIILLAHRIS